MPSTAPEHEIVIAQTPEERQQCYDVVSLLHSYALKHVLSRIISAFRRLCRRAEIPTRLRTRQVCWSSELLEALSDRNRFDETATHFLLRLTPSLIPIGTIRVFKVPDAQYYKLTRLAVLKEYRRFSFGRKLVQAMHDWVRDAVTHAGQTGSVQIVAHSQFLVKGFYAK